MKITLYTGRWELLFSLLSLNMLFFLLRLSGDTLGNKNNGCDDDLHIITTLSPSDHSSVCPSVCLSVCPPLCPSVCPLIVIFTPKNVYVCLSVFSVKSSLSTAFARLFVCLSRKSTLFGKGPP